MGRSLKLRFAVTLAICGLVGLGLSVSAGGDGRWRPRGTVVTTSDGIVHGGFRGSSSTGIVLGVGEQVQVVPWNAVSEISFADGASGDGRVSPDGPSALPPASSRAPGTGGPLS